MKTFKDLKIKYKLAMTFLVVLIPLMVAGGFAFHSFTVSLEKAAELELTNIVNHLFHLCQVQNKQDNDDNNAPSEQSLSLIRDMINTLTVGITGYAYIMDSQGNLIIHPAKTGRNIYDVKDSKGFEFIRAICHNAKKLNTGQVGTIRYPWQNIEEGEHRPRMKIIKYRYYKQWDWVIAAGSYEEEIFDVLTEVRWYTGLLVGLSALLVVLLTLALHRMITRPLSEISSAVIRMAKGDLNQRVNVPSHHDELGALAKSFNVMADQIREKTDLLEQLVRERTRELSESREQYRNLVESAVDGIVTADHKGRITFANQGIENILELKREDLLGRGIWEIYHGGVEEARHIMNLLKKSKHLGNYEMEVIGRNRIVPIRTTASLLHNSHGEVTGSLGIFNDITQERLLRKELQEAQANLIQTMKLRALGDLVSGVAHEVNNPLMAATTMIHVALKDLPEDDESNRRRLDVIRKCHDRIAKIVNHLREFSRQSQQSLEVIDVNLPLNNALLITGQQLLNMSMLIQRDLAEDLPPIMGDINQLEQVFMNLIANARDAMEEVERSRVLKVRSFRSMLEGKEAVAISIADTGPGMPAEVIEKMYEPFFTTKGVHKGTGLGLSISYGIISDHRGKIEVDSAPSKGTEFIITFPATKHAGEKADQGA